MDKKTEKCIGMKGPNHESDFKSSIKNECFSPTLKKINYNEIPVIHCDAMAFGMGCCCVQCTFQCATLNEATFIYDQLVSICPLFLSLTASTPIVRGLLANTDLRWMIISASVDDRNKEEQKSILKSRYDSVSLYISENENAKKYSDLKITYNEKVYETLKKLTNFTIREITTEI